MPRHVKVATTQMEISRDPAANLVRVGGKTSSAGGAHATAYCSARQRRPDPVSCLQDKAEKMVREAAAAGANVILLQVSAPSVMYKCRSHAAAPSAHPAPALKLLHMRPSGFTYGCIF